MFTVFNIALILMVGLIAYWWANQGLFSAILHLLCVIAAGAIALALWEPVTVGFLLRGSGFDVYAWGVSLIGMFVAVLLVLRLVMDKVIPSNVKVPHWADFVFGLPIGAAAGVLTMGIFMIGAGFIQSSREIMGFVGHARSTQNGQVQEIESLWLPVHVLTGDFYRFLSATSLYPTFNNTPMSAYDPNLALRAASLQRDSFNGGRGKITLAPKDASVTKFLHLSDADRYAVTIEFNKSAIDFGEQLTLSSSQVQLIGRVPRGSSATAKTAFPDQWVQWSGRHRFDDFSHYASSEAGQSQATISFEFKVSDLGNQEPAFIMIRGTRFRLPAKETATSNQWASEAGSMASSASTVQLVETAASIQDQVEQSFSIRPVSASINQKPPEVELTDRFISGGHGEFQTSGMGRPARNLEILGILEPAGTRLVQVNVSRGGPASIFEGGTNLTDRVLLVDSQGRGYAPIGYIHTKPDGKTVIKVDFQNGISTLGEMPSLPTANTHTLKLVFRVTDGATVRGLVVGSTTIGTCTLDVKDPKAKPADSATGGNMGLGKG